MYYNGYESLMDDFLKGFMSNRHFSYFNKNVYSFSIVLRIKTKQDKKQENIATIIS